MIRLIQCALAALLAGAILLLWPPWQASAPVASQGHWLRVQPQLLERRLGVLGRIQPAQQVTLAAPFEGTVQVLAVREGEQVAAGQTLLALDTAQLDIQLREADAQRLKASRALRELQAWQSGPEVTRAQRALTVARRTLQHSEAALADTRRLLARGIVARQELDTLEQQVSGQRLELVSAADELQQTKARGQGEYLHIAGMELSNAQARYDALAALRAQRVVKAPFAGLVTRAAAETEGQQRLVQAGQLVSQGMPLLGLVELGRLQVLAAVEQGDLGKVREGMSVQVTGEGFPGQLLQGTVQSLGLQARDDEGPGAWFDVRVQLATQPDPLALGVRLGMSAQVTVLLYRKEQGMAVPEQALRSGSDGRQYVLYRAGPGHVESQVAVVVGEVLVQGVEVEGLQAGEVLLP